MGVPECSPPAGDLLPQGCENHDSPSRTHLPALQENTYFIEATDGGVGGGKAGDTFAFTVFFDPEKAPVNHSIFGPKFTFTAKMVEGEVTITDPRP